MAEREADRNSPDRLRSQATAALESDARKEISQGFRERLRQHDSSPGFFDANALAELAGSGLEVEIVRTIEADPGIGSADATCDALRQRAENYCRELRCELDADRHPQASTISGVAKRAFEDGAAVAAAHVLELQPPPPVSKRVGLSDDLLAPQSAGARP